MIKTWIAAAAAAWGRLARREQQALSAALVVVGLALLWWVGLQPAWKTWRDVPLQREQLEVQGLEMQRLASEARDLKAQPSVSPEQSTQALQAATERLGSKGKLSVVGDRATLTVSGVSTDQLAAWLAEVRSGARARPVELQLNRAEAGLSGQVAVALPASAH